MPGPGERLHIMLSHEFFVISSYAATAIVILGLFSWIVLDGRARQAELVRLEKQGAKRRSDHN